MKILLHLACIFLLVQFGHGEGDREFFSILSEGITDAAKLYFSRNVKLDGSGFNVINEEDFYTPIGLFETQYGKDASTAGFTAGLLDFEYFESSNLTFSDVTQLVVVGEFQDARKKFSAYIEKTVEDRLNDYGIVSEENIEDVSQIIRAAFLSLYDFVDSDSFASFLNLKLGSSLSFVMDTTGSMAGEIEAAKERVQEIIDATKGTNDAPLNYILMPYNDPGYGPLTKTSDPEEFTKALALLSAGGGGNEPELAMIGILKAAQSSAYRSIVYVFTDASALDTDIQNHVIALCLIKKVSVYIFLTTDIARKKRELLRGRALYDQVVDQTGGSVLFVGKSEITAATAVMQATTTQGLVTLESISNANASSISVHVDPSVESLLVQFNGDFDYKGETGPTFIKTSLASISELELFRLDGVTPGTYTFDLDRGTFNFLNKYGVLIRAKSTLGFHATLSQKKGEKFVASRQLKAHKETVTDFFVYGDAEKVIFQRCQLVSRSGIVLIDLPVVKKSHTEYGLEEPFDLPSVPMFVRLVGVYEEGQQQWPIERVDPCAITPTVSNSLLGIIPDQIVQSGDTITVTTTFRNMQEDDDIIIGLSDNQDFTTIIGNPKFSSTVGSEKTIQIQIRVSAGTKEGILSKVLLTATGVTSNYYIFTTFVVSVIDGVTRCPILISPGGGSLQCTNGRSVGSRCVLTCGSEYLQHGAGSVECGLDGSWSLKSIGSCELLRSKTCRLSGDPHYRTFDGRRFDFMGTCLYTLFQTVEDAQGIEPITCSTENTEQHVRRKVSWLKQFFVTVYNITVHFKYGKVVLIDGIRINLPALLLGGNVQIKRDGGDVILTTDFKMTVRYDGKHNLRVKLPASYRGKVTGLCGNYDDDVTNDFMFGNNTFTDAALFGNAHEIVGSLKPGCRQGEVGDDVDGCTEPAQRAIYAEKCAAIKTDCFMDCASEERIQELFDECVYDMCATGGNSKTVEDALTTFADFCADLNIQICDWRDRFNYPKICEKNSQYKSHANRCPNTCVDPNAESRCVRKPKTEACVCNKGFVRDGNDCVRLSQCGCSANGRYYKKGENFLTSNCLQRCECTNGKLTCKATSCEEDRECRVLPSGKYGCQLKQVDVCYATGDPHYQTLDGSKFDFMGVCSYIMVSTDGMGITDPNRGIVIVAQNENRNGNTRVSYIKLVTIKILDFEIQLGPGKTLTIKRNGTRIELPATQKFTNDNELFETKILGRKARFSTKFGVEVKFDGTNLYINVPSYYMHKVGGLCGNYTGVKDDDFGGRTLMNFTKNYLYSDGCGEDPDREELVCTDADKAKWGGAEFCGKLKNPDSPLKYCYDIVDVQPYFDDCVFDACAYEGDVDVIQNAISVYKQACEDKNVDLSCRWEEEIGFTLPACPDNSRYDACASVCVNTCQDPEASTGCLSVETVARCVCELGYVLNNGECVEDSVCGCTFEVDGYVEQGAFYMAPGCAYSDRCVGAGSAIREEDPCGKEATCKLSNSGEYQCIPDEFAYALVYGKIHFKTFDNKFFDFQGDCGYLLAGYGRPDSDEKDSLAFAVYILNGGWEYNEGISLVVKVWKGDKKNVIKVSPKKIVMVDDVRVAAGSQVGQVSVGRKLGKVVLSFEFGLHVLFNGYDWVRVDVDHKYKEKMYGLGGNYNDQPSDDMLVGGDMMFMPRQWGDHWRMAEFSCSRCNKDTEEIDRTCALKARYERSCDCGVLTDTDGPFAACHEKMDAQPFFKSCVLSACRNQGSSLAIAMIMKAYYFACLGKGVKIEKWREAVSIPMECPENSHYVECASQCQPRCGEKDPDCRTSTCAESCVCDDGYILSNGKCVDEDKCGCMEDDYYFEHGDSRTDSECTSRCTCIYGDWDCEDIKCNDDQMCELFNGAHDCYWKDKCKYDNGGCEDSCESIDNVAYCTCYPGRILTWDNRTCVGISPSFFGEGMNKCDTEFNVWRQEFYNWKNTYLSAWVEELEAYKEYVKSGIVSDAMNLCRYSWTKWYDIDDPEGQGDEEKLEYLKREYPEICDKPIAGEGRMANEKSIGTAIANFSVDHTGLICKNADQEKGKKCPDFAVRFLCPVKEDNEAPRCG
uniref:IgGFc-binding protein-like n=1 Tax=Styela clava TaxID=7725 RepID=UPI00193A5D5D|nr:IgGFc-binding protein-like [Styela clava]